MRIVRDNDELYKISEHLYYEFWMLGKAMELLSYKQDIGYTNIAIESFGIHARVLVEFLFRQSASETDVLAIDFLNDKNSWLQFIDDKKGIYDYVRKRTGKEIAHLTIDRLHVTPKDKIWNCPAIYKKITGLFIEFLKRVPDERINSKLIAIKNRKY